ncbi:MAG: lipid-A-disaccharide synthase [Acidobacteria bacterium RIFCSPLOWO2_12_FULL_67_14b]|nr:MAG: lipid-A-disaccharide synthase [Acidobacteria bacterium RIFCSPLOWO2_12_FULL_67_14b]
MISCGEPSGDLYAGALVAALRAREPGIDVFGLGGERLAAAGGRLVANFHGLSVTGLTEALRVLPRSWTTLRQLVDAAREQKPDALVVIDYPDFNFRLMRAIKRLGVPVIYYVSPQLWAWRAGRIRTMKRVVDCVLPIFPFEEAIYRRENMDVRFVGHPLIDLATPTRSRDEFLRQLRLDPARPVVALLPGSRTNELTQLVPVIADAIPRIVERVPRVQFVVARAPNLADTLFEGFGLPGATLRIVEAQTDDVLNACDVVVTASGTATVQAALHGKPMVVLYKLSPMTYRLGKPLARVDIFAMVNLIAGERVVVELIQGACTGEAVAGETIKLLEDAPYRDRMTVKIAEVRARLGSPGASARAADAVLHVIHSSRHVS